MKYLSRLTSLLLITVLTILLLVPATTVEAKSRKASKKPSIEEYYIDGYGDYFRVRVKNKTKKTIVVSQKAKFYAPTYEYLGPGNPNQLDYYEDPDEYLSYELKYRTITYKPKKSVKIKPGKSKWVYYTKITEGYYGFEDMSEVKVTVGYKQGGKKKSCSEWLELDFDY